MEVLESLNTWSVACQRDKIERDDAVPCFFIRPSQKILGGEPERFSRIFWDTKWTTVRDIFSTHIEARDTVYLWVLVRDVQYPVKDDEQPRKRQKIRGAISTVGPITHASPTEEFDKTLKADAARPTGQEPARRKSGVREDYSQSENLLPPSASGREPRVLEEKVSKETGQLTSEEDPDGNNSDSNDSDDDGFLLSGDDLEVIRKPAYKRVDSEGDGEEDGEEEDGEEEGSEEED